MIPLASLLAEDHVRSWRFGLEAVLLAIFLVLLREARPETVDVAMYHATLFGMGVTVVTALRLARANASKKARYLALHGGGRTAVLLAAAAASTALGLALAAGAALGALAMCIRPGLPSAASVVMMTLAVAATASLATSLSGLVLDHWGTLAVPALVIYLAVGSSSAPKLPQAASIALRFVDAVSPPLGSAALASGGRWPMGLPLLVLRLALPSVLALTAAAFAVRRRDLLFRE